MTESHTRSLAKAISWRITGSVDTFLISWFVTGQPQIASSIALMEVFTKVFLYWAHERVWDTVKLGRQ